MNSFDLCYELKHLNNALDKNINFNKTLKYLSSLSPIIDTTISDAYDSTIQKKQDKEVIALELNKASHYILKEKKFLKTVTEGNELSKFFENSIVSSTKAMMSVDSPQYHIYTIHKDINIFLQTYEDFLSSRQKKDVFRLIRIAYSLSLTISNLKGFLNNITSHLIKKVDNDVDDRQHITIIFNDIHRPIDFSNKIKELIEAYEIISSLINISPSESPIEFLKIESGSPLFTRFSGNPIVITIITNLLLIGTQYIYASYTTNSEIEKIPKAAKAANEILKLTDQLKLHGYDVKLDQDNIKETVSNLSSKLNYLISDQSKIKINNIQHEIPKNPHISLENTKKKAIGHQLTDNITNTK